MKRDTIKRDGRTYVLVPKKTYDRMVEDIDDLADIRAYDRAMAAAQEFFPLGHVKRLFDDDRNPVAVWREFRGLTQAKLAARAGISVPFLSQIEHGKRDPSLATLRRIAAALKVDLDDLSPIAKLGT
jgi:DNA-binding XRE family transcriptional regulator